MRSINLLIVEYYGLLLLLERIAVILAFFPGCRLLRS